MRLFAAVNFSDEIKRQILIVQEQLRSRALSGNFSRSENFHITLAFLGETPEEKLESLFGIIDKIEAPAFEIRFNSTGCFTHSRKELWWIGADRNSSGFPVLLSIHKQLLTRLLAAGFHVDTRPFNAHITLGREIKHSGPIILDKPDIKLNANRVSLMKSEHVRGVLTYTEIYGKGSTPSMEDFPHNSIMSRSSPMATPEQAGKAFSQDTESVFRGAKIFQ